MGDLMVVQTDFPMGKEPKKTIERLTEAMSDVRANPVGPGGHPSDHFMTRSSSARSWAVIRYPRSYSVLMPFMTSSRFLVRYHWSKRAVNVAPAARGGVAASYC